MPTRTILVQIRINSKTTDATVLGALEKAGFDVDLVQQREAAKVARAERKRDPQPVFDGHGNRFDRNSTESDTGLRTHDQYGNRYEDGDAPSYRRNKGRGFDAYGNPY